MWIVLLELLVDIGLLRVDYQKIRQVDKLNADQNKSGVKTRYVLLPSAKIILTALVVVLIFGIVKAVVISQKIGVSPYSEMGEIEKALYSYQSEFGRYPADLDKLMDGRPLRKAWTLDEWERPYRYETDDLGKTFLLMSLGKDGRLNTSDDLIVRSE